MNKQKRKKGRAGGRTPGVLVPQETVGDNRIIKNEQTILTKLISNLEHWPSGGDTGARLPRCLEKGPSKIQTFFINACDD